MTAREWLIADGLGGYAMGTDDGIRTRRYHSLLLVAAPESEQRFVLVNGVEAWLDTADGPVALTTQRYVPDTLHPDGASRITAFRGDPWPAWTIGLPDGEVQYEIVGVHGHVATMLRWRVSGKARVKLRVRLQMSGRDWHSLHRENMAFRFDGERALPGTWRFQGYAGVPPVVVYTAARYEHRPLWFRRVQYDEERARGLDYVEDLASPGEFTFDLNTKRREATLVLTTSTEWGGLEIEGSAADAGKALRAREQRRVTAFPSRRERAADSYIVQRGARRTIIAGYPWFTDWGRDTFISLPGLCLPNRVEDAQAILLSWCAHLSDGMMPNVFPSEGKEPEYNSVDAALWFVAAVRALTEATPGPVRQVPVQFIAACEEILTRYARGTRFGIRMDGDGLLAAGAPGMALTWMDAVVDGVPVTPRSGKAVEVQALWIDALQFAASWNTRWNAVAARARESFTKRFWNAGRGCLFDAVDVDHLAGAVDDRLRPNQIFACGGLSRPLLPEARARAVLDLVERELWTPMGLRSLARGEAGYVGRVDGPLRQRDLGYHQGTVWPWLTGAFLRAWASCHAGGLGAARARFGTDVMRLPEGNAGHVPEIADGDAPHEPRGCPFQAWSLAELPRTTPD
ncbi:MAG: amylo-alpha-1,6-glucosidase [Gemmatimonadota bacterium]